MSFNQENLKLLMLPPNPLKGEFSKLSRKVPFRGLFAALMKTQAKYRGKMLN
jgi:hypothetical protein